MEEAKDKKGEEEGKLLQSYVLCLSDVILITCFDITLFSAFWLLLSVCITYFEDRSI